MSLPLLYQSRETHLWPCRACCRVVDRLTSVAGTIVVVPTKAPGKEDSLLKSDFPTCIWLISSPITLEFCRMQS